MESEIGPPKMMQISVIIPLFNKEETIGRAVESFLKQSYENKELIIIDDGSTDGSRGAVEDYLAFPAIRFFHQSNGGVSSARNEGVRQARAEYVCFLDGDDEWEEGFLEEIVGMVHRYPNAILYSCCIKIVDENGRRVLWNTNASGVLPGVQDDFFKSYRENRGLVHSSSVCVRKTCFERLGGFPLGEKIGEDIYFWFKLALNGKVCCSKKRLAIVHRNSSNRTVDRVPNGFPYQLKYFLVDKHIYEVDPDHRQSLLNALLHSSLVNFYGARVFGSKALIKKYLAAISPYSRKYTVLFYALAITPKILLRCLRNVRNAL